MKNSLTAINYSVKFTSMSENLQKYRFLESFLPNPKNKRLVILTGARQTGKTTLARYIYPQLNYINLDSPENREFIRTISSASWSKSIGNSIIDEAQKEPVVFEKVKYAYDEGGISFCLLSGSSQILLLKKIRESLAGRASLYELWPLMMSEIYRDAGGPAPRPPLIDRFFSPDPLDRFFRGLPEALLDKEDTKYREAEIHLLQWGGMPALLSLAEDERWKWLKDYEFTYLERDLSDLARLDDLGPFRKFQKLSALRSGKLLNYSELARDASVSIDTARRYLEYLRLSYQTILLQPFYKNITSSVIKTPKIYWMDVGLLRQLTGFKGEHLAEVYETMVVGEILKWMKTAQKDGEVYFYRTRSGLELDILLQTQSGLIGMEIKARREVAKTDLRAMKEIAEHLGDTWRGGVLVYQGDTIRKLAEPCIWAVPSRRLFI
jgi:predicted AAA+ superfamily ATPase